LILYDADVAAPNPFTTRLFIHERGGITFDTKVIALSTLENRAKPYREQVNPRGEVPALRLDDGRVLTEVTAICEYIDELAVGGQTLIGTTADERAFTRSWTRWADLEIAQGAINWWRGSEAATDFYRGHRVIFREGQHELRQMAERGLNMLDDHLGAMRFLCNDKRPMLADILLFGILFSMSRSGPWMTNPGRTNVVAWFERMMTRPSCEAAAHSFTGHVSV
jgi:glutathione S-transferase